MTSTTSDTDTAVVVGAAAPVGVRGLDDRSVLVAMAEARRVADRAEADLLGFAVHYVDLHPVTEDHPAATPGEGDRCLQEDPAGTDTGTDPTTGGPVGLGGPGTPGIAEYAVEALGAHLSLSYPATYALLSEAVELCHRLPRLWELVRVGRLQAWKARQVTVHTRSVSAAAAGFVDRHLAGDAARNRVPTLSRLRALTHEALLQCDPDTAQGREEAALAARDVTFDHRSATSTGVSTMTATLDTLDALDLHDTLTELATTMGHLGDTSPVGVRRAHALGMLARPDGVLELFGSDGATGAEEDHLAVDQVPPAAGPFTRTTATLYVHVNAEDVVSATGGRRGVGAVEKLGAATLDLIRAWLARTSQVTVRPVLHHAGDARLDACCTPVDRHDPPNAMREAVILRDGHCVFPGCTIDARSCDLDHITAYLDPDHGGPPGQTSPENLGCLCRRHHRLKTFTAWTYRRRPDGTYQWTSPAGRTYLAAPTPKTAPHLT